MSTEHAAGAAGEAMGRKVGGMSVGTWLLLGGAGVGIGLYLRNRNAAASAPVTVTDNTDTAPGAGNLAVGWQASNPTSAGPTDPTAAASLPSTNADWSVLAQRVLIGMNYDGVSVSSAIASYLQGDPLTAAQAALVALAIGKAGPAPEYVPPQAPGQVITPTTPTIPPRQDVHPPVTVTNVFDRFTKMGNTVFGHFTGDSTGPLFPLLFDHYLRDAQGRIYGINAYGNPTWLTPSAYKALGSPKVTQVTTVVSNIPGVPGTTYKGVAQSGAPATTSSSGTKVVSSPNSGTSIGTPSSAVVTR